MSPSRPFTIVLSKDYDLEDIGLWSEMKKEGYRVLWVIDVTHTVGFM